MKKSIISILLVMAMFFTMTACVAKSDTVNPKVEHECKVEYFDVYPNTDIPQITPEEVPASLAEMVRISTTEDLCWADMRVIGSNFATIWQFYNSYCDKAEFEAQAITAFNNVFEQANKKNIPLDEIDSWTDVPVTEVLCKYYSSQNFSYPNNPYLTIPFEDLTEEDVAKVSEVFFSNPVFATNTTFATSLLYHFPNGVAANMAYESLLKLAQNASEEDYESIAQVVIELYHKYGISSNEVDTLLDNYDVELLTSCLVKWKGIANTSLPTFY